MSDLLQLSHSVASEPAWAVSWYIRIFKASSGMSSGLEQGEVPRFQRAHG